jgi:prepilin-type N-terminal cleavage/methylation domain-containing protein
MKNQHGFTLVELLVAIAISGIVMSAFVSTFFHVAITSGRASDTLIASKEFQNVGHWINRDGQTAKSAIGGAELVLTLPDESTITYTLVDTQLQRLADGLSMTVGNNITDITFSVDDRIITVELTSSAGGGTSEEDSFQVRMRPTG